MSMAIRTTPTQRLTRDEAAIVGAAADVDAAMLAVLIERRGLTYPIGGCDAEFGGQQVVECRVLLGDPRFPVLFRGAVVDHVFLVCPSLGGTWGPPPAGRSWEFFDA
jgi:hypothetical protein